MLDDYEALEIQRKFGASLAQVKRDHAISHLLCSLQKVKSNFVFFGGTGLARTHLADGRLSEDIDLYTNNRVGLLAELEAIPDWIEQEFPKSNWTVSPTATRDPKSAILNCGPGILIQVQIVDSSSRGWTNIPTEILKIEQRYSDVSSTKLAVPTFDGFVAMKALAWFDRGAPRDLFDLSALSTVGSVSGAARTAIQAILGHQLSAAMMNRYVSGDWDGQLAHQTMSFGSPIAALSRVIAWWGNGDAN